MVAVQSNVLTVRRRPRNGDNGSDAVRYWLLPSVTTIKKSALGVLTPSTVTCTQMKQVGNNTATTTNEKTIKYQLSGGEIVNYTGEVTVSFSNTYIDFFLYDGSNIIDTFRIPVVSDGVNGGKGDQGELGPLVYPEGEYSNTKTYTRTSTTTPVVLFKGDYYVLGVIGSVTGASPETDNRWVKMNKLLYTFIEVLFANFAKLGSAIFSGDYLISQNGIDYNGQPSTSYQDFTNENFSSDVGNWDVSAPTITTMKILTSTDKAILLSANEPILKGEHRIAIRKNGALNAGLRLSYSGSPYTFQVRYYYGVNKYIQILPEGVTTPICDEGYSPEIRIFSPYDSLCSITIKNQDAFIPNIAINWKTGKVKSLIGDFENANIYNADIENSIINNCKIESAFIQGASKLTSVVSGEKSITSNFVVFDSPSNAAPILKVPTKEANGFDLTLNAPVEFKIMNLNNYVINVLFKSDSSGNSNCKAYNGFSFGGSTSPAVSSTTINFNVLSIPAGWMSNLIFIPTSKAAGMYYGVWYLLDSNRYQLYYNVNASTPNYRYEMVPIPINATINR